MSVNNQVATQMPKRNGVIAFLYWVLVIFMFVFALTLINQYWGLMLFNQSSQASAGVVHAEPGNAKNSSVQLVEKKSDTNKNNLKPKVTEKVLTGLRARLDLKGDIEKQIGELWAGLYAKEVYKKMPKGTDDKKIYMAYYNYSTEKQTVDVLLGYDGAVDEDDGSGLTKKVIDSEGHIETEGKTVLEVWQNPEGRKLSFDEDYDVYHLDKEWTVIRTVSMVGIEKSN